MRRVAVMAFLIVLAAPAGAAAQQSGGLPPPAAPKAKSSGEVEDVLHPPLVFAGWTYGSIIRNGATASINLARGRKIPKEDAVAWRGLEFSGTVGSRGFELGAGYARMIIASQFPIGWEVRAVGGRRWDKSDTLSPAQSWVGGEVGARFMNLRVTAGLVVPADSGRSHQPVLTGSVGFQVPLTGFTKAERAYGRTKRGGK